MLTDSCLSLDSLPLYSPQYFMDTVHIWYSYWTQLEREIYWLWGLYVHFIEFRGILKYSQQLIPSRMINLILRLGKPRVWGLWMFSHKFSHKIHINLSYEWKIICKMSRWTYLFPIYIPDVWGCYQTENSWACSLTYWGWDKMSANLETTFSNAFSWMKMYEFQL